MNIWEYFIVTAAAVLVLFTQQSNGLELSLCLKEIIDQGCQNAKNPLDIWTDLSSESDTINKNKDPADAKYLLKIGFINFNNTVAAAKRRAMDGFSLAIKLVITQPKAAAQAVQEAIQDAQDTFYDALAFVYQALGEASSVYEDTARQGLAEANQKLQLVALELLDEMRTVTTLANQGIRNGGEAAIEAIEFSRQGIQAGFAALHYETVISYQQTIGAVSVAQLQRRPMQCRANNQNPDTAAKDSETTASISQLNKDADEAIKKGADPCLVNPLRVSLTNSLYGLALVASNVKDYFAYIKKLAETDAISAKNVYLAESKGVCKGIQEIFANISLNLGAAGVNSDDSTKRQIRNAIETVEHGNDEMVVGNKIAKHFTLLALLFEGDVRRWGFSAAAQSGRYGKIALDKKVVEAAKIAFNAL